MVENEKVLRQKQQTKINKTEYEKDNSDSLQELIDKRALIGNLGKRKYNKEQCDEIADYANKTSVREACNKFKCDYMTAMVMSEGKYFLPNRASNKGRVCKKTYYDGVLRFDFNRYNTLKFLKKILCNYVSGIIHIIYTPSTQKGVDRRHCIPPIQLF